MNLVDKIKEARRNKKMFEEMIYKRVLEEMSNNQIQTGLWAKALADSLGDINKTTSFYIKYRAETLREESDRLYEKFERKQKSESSKLNQEQETNKKFYLPAITPYLLMAFFLIILIIASIFGK